MTTTRWLAAMTAAVALAGSIPAARAADCDVESLKQAAITAVHTAAAGLGSALKDFPDKDAQLKLIRDFIEPVRFFSDQSGYFYVYNFDCVNVAHATQKDLIGKNLFGHQDSRGKLDIQALCAAAKAGGGFVEYYWVKPGSQGEFKKLGYVEPIPGTDFFIGTGIYLPGDVPVAEQPGDPPPPEILGKAAEQLNASLQALDRDMADLAQRMVDLNPDSPAARELLQQVLAKHPFVLDVCFVSPEGIMAVVEPASYKHVEGSDISQQTQVIEIHQTKKPIMSQSFLSVEGFPGVDIEYPVMQGSVLKGSVSAFIRPDQFIGGILSPLCQISPVSLLAMQNDGTSLYDPDPQQIGKNLFADPLYQPFPELRQLGRSVAAQNAGSGRYTFFAPGTTNLVAKEAHWTTVSLYGTEWKLMSMKELAP